MRLRISKWAETYETTEGRVPKGPLSWYRVPTLDGGIGIKMIERNPEGMAFYGIWNRLCHETAKLDQDKRGLLIRGNGEPYTVEDLCLLNGGGPVDLWERAIAFFLQPKPGWLIDEDAKAAPTVKEILTVALPPIEQPSIYELAADRMIQMYRDAEAPQARLCGRDALSRALLDAADGPNAEATLRTIEGNLAEHIRSTSKPEMLLTLSRWPKDARALAPLPEVKPDTSKQDAERLRAEMEQAWAALTVAERERLLVESKRQWANHVQFDEDFALSMAKQEAWRRANEYAA